MVSKMDMQITSLSKPVRVLLFGAFIVFGAYAIWIAVQTESFSIDSVEELRAAFYEVAPPEGATLSGKVRSSSKITVQAVYADYVAPVAAIDVVNYYRDNLPRKGWKLASSKETARGGQSFRFCRGDKDVVLEIVEPSSLANGVRYYLGVHRENGPAVKTGCN